MDKEILFHIEESIVIILTYIQSTHIHWLLKLQSAFIMQSPSVFLSPLHCIVRFSFKTNLHSEIKRTSSVASK